MTSPEFVENVPALTETNGEFWPPGGERVPGLLRVKRTSATVTLAVF